MRHSHTLYVQFKLAMRTLFTTLLLWTFISRAFPVHFEGHAITFEDVHSVPRAYVLYWLVKCTSTVLMYGCMAVNSEQYSTSVRVYESADEYSTLYISNKLIERTKRARLRYKQNNRTHVSRAPKSSLFDGHVDALS